MRVFTIIFSLVLLFVVAQAKKSREYNRPESHSGLEDVLKLLHQQPHLDKELRRELRQKFLRREITFDQIAEKLGANTASEFNTKLEGKVQSIKQKLADKKRR